MKKFVKLALMSLVAVWAITGCQNPTGSNQDQGEGARGSLTVSMNDAVSRSILPGISMNPASYDLVGAGPNGASFSQSVTGGNSLTLSDLAFGAWTVTVTAKNGSGTPIGQGNGTVTVMSNASASLSITVRPYDGFGTLALNVSWPAAQVQTAQIQSTLTPANGTARDLAFTVNGSAGTASLTASDVATGYHTLVLKLLDNGHLAIGAVEVVRIVKDQTSSGTLAFTNVNQSTGTLEVNVTPEMSDPLEVSISGSAATKPANKSLSLSAVVSNYSDNVTYVWYVNGDAKATGASYSFDDSWAKGFYRIDVTAYSADGKRAGSTTTNVQVVEAESSLPDSEKQLYPTTNTQQTPSIVWTGSEYGIVWSEVTNTNIGTICFLRADKQGKIIGDVVQISTDANVNTSPEIHWNGLNWVVVWVPFFRDSGTYAIRFRQLDRTGTPTSAVITLNSIHDNVYDITDLVWDGQNYALVYRVWTDYRLVFMKFSPSGTLLGSETTVVDSGKAAWHPALAWNGSSYGLAWIDQRYYGNPSGNDEIFYKQLDSNGIPLTDDIRISTAQGSSWDPDLVWIGDSYALSWVDARNGPLHAMFTYIREDGIKKFEEISLSSYSQRQDCPAIAWSGNRTIVTFSNGDILHTTIVNQTGGIEVQDAIASTRGIHSFEPSSAWDGEAAATVWYDSRKGRRQIYFSRISSDGVFF